jgi:predicted transcriptional regulator
MFGNFSSELNEDTSGTGSEVLENEEYYSIERMEAIFNSSSSQHFHDTYNAAVNESVEEFLLDIDARAYDQLTSNCNSD